MIVENELWEGGNGMGKFREMGERVYNIWEVIESVNVMGFGIGNFITG